MRLVRDRRRTHNDVEHTLGLRAATIQCGCHEVHAQFGGLQPTAIGERPFHLLDRSQCISHQALLDAQIRQVGPLVAVLTATNAPVLAGLRDCLAHGAHVATGQGSFRFPHRQHPNTQFVQPTPRRRLAQFGTRPRPHLAVRRHDPQEIVESTAFQHAVSHLPGKIPRVQ